MDAVIYILHPGSLHWYVSERYPNVTEKERQQIEAYVEQHQPQIKVEYV